MKPLTKRAREALQWMLDNEPVSLFPLVDKRCPSRALRKRFEADGLIETAGVEAGRFGFTRFSVTEAGRAILSDLHAERAKP